MLQANDISIAYENRMIVDSLNLEIREGEITTIIGPNGCGKTTLLRSLSRLLSPKKGSVLLEGQDIHSMHTTAVARKMGLLSQQAEVPDRITVAELVARGRYPHQKLIRQWSVADEAAVVEAMTATGVTSLSARPVDELSGGQRHSS